MMEELGDQCNALVITAVEDIQDASNDILKNFSEKNLAGAYICLNRPQHAVKKILADNEIDTEHIFFIDCISSTLIGVKKEDNVMHISNPADLTGLSIAISEFIKRVPGEKYLLIDALGTLLIYNHEDIVIKFIRSVLEESSAEGVCTIMLTPKTEDDTWTRKIIPFFDKVIHKDSEDNPANT